MRYDCNFATKMIHEHSRIRCKLGFDFDGLMALFLVNRTISESLLNMFTREVEVTHAATQTTCTIKEAPKSLLSIFLSLRDAISDIRLTDFYQATRS